MSTLASQLEALMNPNPPSPLRAGVLAGGGAEGESALVTMSTLTEEGVSAVKQVACDRLLNSRVEVKLKVGWRLIG